MSKSGTALVGYAILRANYDVSARSYLDNFTRFVLSAIANAGETPVDKYRLSEIVEDLFGINIPPDVVSRILKRTRGSSLTDMGEEGVVWLTQKGLEETQDLVAEMRQYEGRQSELVDCFQKYVKNEFAHRMEEVYSGAADPLTEFIEKNAALLLRASWRGDLPNRHENAAGSYAAASFIDHLNKVDQTRFQYVLEAAKGAMLASVLELDTSCMKGSLADLTLYLDTPVVMDLLGYHSEAPRLAMEEVCRMALGQGANLAVFRHTVSEVEGILFAAESAIRSGAANNGHFRASQHFLEVGMTPSDIALHRERLEESLQRLDVAVVDKPFTYRDHGIDEKALDDMLEREVGYSQSSASARVNDVDSIAAVHRLRKGSTASTFEKCRSLLISSNTSLVKAVGEFSFGYGAKSFPVSITVEWLATLLWVRSSALQEDLPRRMLLASAYVGMQPPPALWKKYVDEIEKLRASGKVSADDAIVLRASWVSNEFIMKDTLGDESAVDAELPLNVLSRYKEMSAEPYNKQITILEERIAELEKSRDAAEGGRARQLDVNEELKKELERMRGTQKEQRERLKAKAKKRARAMRIVLMLVLIAGFSVALFFAFWFGEDGGSMPARIVYVLSQVATLFGGVKVPSLKRVVMLESKFASWLEKRYLDRVGLDNESIGE